MNSCSCSLEKFTQLMLYTAKLWSTDLFLIFSSCVGDEETQYNVSVHPLFLL